MTFLIIISCTLPIYAFMHSNSNSIIQLIFVSFTKPGDRPVINSSLTAQGLFICFFVCLFSWLVFKNIFIFRNGEGKEKERERNINVWLPLACPTLGTWPATQACALIGNRTGNPLVHSLCSIH